MDPGDSDIVHRAAPAASVPEITGRRRRRLLLARAGAVAIGALIAGPAAAEQISAFINHAPQSEGEADRMEIIYHGPSYSWAQIADLQSQGKAMMAVLEPTSYDRGQAHAFDTATEAEAWECANVPGLAERPVCAGGQVTAAPASS